MSVRIDDILERLKEVRPTGPHQWQALCPAHDDEVPSFHIATGDNGNILVHCKAGCSFDKICQAINVSPKDLFTGDNGKAIKSNSKDRLLSDGDIRTLTAEELNVFVKQREITADALMRFEPKRHVSKPWIVLPSYNPSGTKPCGYMRLDPSGGLVTLADGREEKSPTIGKHGLLGVPWIIRENPEAIVFAEGWRDALAVIDQGFCATASTGGASTFKKEWAGLFRNRIVYICFDCDKAGLKAAKKAARTIAPVATEVRIIKLPYEITKDHGADLHDFLVRDVHSKEELQQLIDEAEPYELSSETIADPDVNFGMDRTDAANAERFVRQHKSKLRYCRQWKTWLYYDGQRWNRDIGPEQACRLALQTAKSIVDEAQKLTAGSEKCIQLLQWAAFSQSATRLRAMLELARFMEPIACLPSIFDADPCLLNCLNGTIDLRTGELRQHNPADMLTKLCPVNYDPDATFDMWDEFLETATDGNQELQKYLQVAMGYSLTGKTDEEKLFFIHGGAATGKSTFTEAIKATMGDYATTADFETFLRRQVGSIRNDIARLHGARFVASTEVDRVQRLAEGLVKMLTGGDTIAARFLYSESFNFLPQLKLWLAANHAPKVRDDDSAIWRRINRVPFTHHIPKEKRDPRIKNTLQSPNVAGPAILAWAVRGCLIWQKEGLIVPDIIETATEEYRQSQDPMAEFYEEECIFEPDVFVPVADLRDAYDKWAEDAGIPEKYRLGRKAFNERLQDKGCERKSTRYTNNVGTEKVGKCWHGVTLKSACNRFETEKPEEIQDEILF